MQKESSSVISSRNDLQIKMKIRSPMTAEQLIEIDKRRQQGFNSLKNLKTLYEIKFYLCLPNLSREEKLLRSRNITENGGIIKVSISNAVNSDNSYESQKDKTNSITDKSNKFSKSMTYMDNECKILQSINSSSCKEVNLLEGKFSSRVKKLIQHSSSQLSAKTNNEETYTDLFSILSNEKYQIIVLSDLINVINRIESWRNNKYWFKYRIHYSLEEPNGKNLNSFFCIASFEKQKQPLYNEYLYQCEIHEFSYILKSKSYCDHTINTKAPQGTSIFYKKVKFSLVITVS